MNYSNEIIDNEIIVYANDNLFSKESIFKCLYWYSNDFHVNISLADSNTFKISLKSVSEDNLSSIQLDNILHKLEKDLIDFNLRDIVTKETKNIRDLLTAKAFSNGEFDEDPPGQISDPVGFNVNDNYDD